MSLWAGIPPMFSPWKVMDPVWLWSRPEMVLRMVDFPAPFAPMRVMIYPSSTVKETSLTAWMAP